MHTRSQPTVKHANGNCHVLTSTWDAAADWYDNIYRPAVTLIRKHAVLDRTGENKKHSEADLYIWMVDHLRDIRRQQGDENTSRKFSHALVDYLTEKKIPIPRELLDEEDDTVMLSRTQVMRTIDLNEKDKE